MPATRSVLIVALIGSMLLGGCSPGTGVANNSATQQPPVTANSNRAIEPGMEGAKDNAEELGTLINMPYEPEDLAWKEFSSGPVRRLLAVFQLTDEDAKKLTDSASKIRAGTPAAISSENWFPKELITQSELSGESGIQATSYAANDFLQPPFNEGTLARVDNTNFFVLEVFAK